MILNNNAGQYLKVSFMNEGQATEKSIQYLPAKKLASPAKLHQKETRFDLPTLLSTLGCFTILWGIARKFDAIPSNNYLILSVIMMSIYGMLGLVSGYAFLKTLFHKS